GHHPPGVSVDPDGNDPCSSVVRTLTEVPPTSINKHFSGQGRLCDVSSMLSPCPVLAGEARLGSHGANWDATLEWPLPICDFWSIQAELIGVVLAVDLLVARVLTNAGSCDLETGHPVDRVNGQAEAVRLVANGKLQRRVDVALLLVSADMDVVLV